MASHSRSGMQNGSGRGHQESRPHLYGADPMHYRQGTAVANGDSPPDWTPEMEINPTYPYNLKEYRRDVGRWIKATRAAPERHGPLLALAIGGAARTILDDMNDDDLSDGRILDIGDGRGPVFQTGPTLLIYALDRKFPANAEAEMLRAGLEFFAFVPRVGETAQVVFMRCDAMLNKANDLADLGISWPFRS